MINYIEVVINSLLRDLILKGPNTELHVKNVTGVASFAAHCHSVSICSVYNNLQGQQTEEETSDMFNVPGLSVLKNTLITTTTKIKTDVAVGKLRRRRRLLYGHLATRHRFALVVYLLGQIHSLLLKRSCCTYRELLYKNVHFPCDPQQISRGVKDVCCMLGQSSWNLGIFSSGKGMITGPVLICMTNGDVIDCSCYKTPTLIPPNFTYIDHFETSAQIVLLVEKDTVFKKLLHFNLFETFDNRVLLVTAKGYPDIATRWMLNKLALQNKLFVYMIADADPHGIEIMLVYRHGSFTFARNSIDLACPTLKWLGVHPSDIVQMNIPEEPMTSGDLKKIDSLLRRPYISHEIRRELCILRQHQAKVKIDNMSVNSFELFISDYIINKIKRNIFI